MDEVSRKAFFEDLGKKPPSGLVGRPEDLAEAVLAIPVQPPPDWHIDGGGSII
jgi:hypothetical protein